LVWPLKPIAHEPSIYAYGTFSQAFRRIVLQIVAAALRAQRMRLVNRET
jgi:hypothetical protein